MAHSSHTAGTQMRNGTLKRLCTGITMILLGNAASSVLVATAIFFSPQFETVSDIPANYFQEHKTIFGRVERVIDGDTVRIRHCKSRLFGCENRMKNGLPPKKIYDSTLSIRLYGVDCPEIKKRSNDPPSQPFGEEAKKYTSDMVLGKTVKVTLYSKDRYGRALSMVETPRPIIPVFGRKDLSVELVDKGLATIYKGGGAEYADKKELLEQKLEKAQRRKVGIWSLGQEMVSPADFKRQQRATQYRLAPATP